MVRGRKRSNSGKSRQAVRVVPPPPPPAQPNQSLVGGLDCLQALVASSAPVGSRDLSRWLGIEHTRINRLLGTLAWMGLAERTPERKYIPGPGVHVLAAMSLRGSKLLGAALPHLQRLGEEAPDFNVALGVLWRRHVAYLYFAAPGQAPQVAIASRDLYPAEKSSIGLNLLAALPDANIRERYADVDVKSTRSVMQRIRDVRTSGHAIVDGRTLGVAIGRPPVAGLALSGSGIRRRKAHWVARLVETTAAIQTDFQSPTTVSAVSPTDFGGL